ncbi:Ppx/GppA family phosphatase [Aristophania vespae]|uniref:Ppx/GppA family phosphatase n=1 Tax=Aristophania vespae TaxID=2697033 RepID=A0A6P1NFZ9_9PROT|nr:Ppx/GppA phosphatase family protein [Aristophania vespae]QHI95450.1 Ppx/GppA family phosphatase [Aristophania vespae]
MMKTNLTYQKRKSFPHYVHSHKIKTPITPYKTPFYYAAIDLGTTSCRLLVVKDTGDALKIIERYSSSVLLGEGLSKTGLLDECAINRTIRTLRLFVKKIHNWPVSNISAIATEVCRQAANAQEFLRRVFEETGLRIDVISDREEAELALESCGSLLSSPRYYNQHMHHSLYARKPCPNRALIFDIGGGSTEISWVRTDHTSRKYFLSGMTSLKHGIVSLTELFDQLTLKEAYNAAVRYITSKLESFESIYCIKREVAQQNVHMIGISGTITTLAGIALDLKRYDRYQIDGTILSCNALAQSIHKIKSMSQTALELHPCIGRSRASLVLAGCAIYEAIQAMWPTDMITVADRGLRDGLVIRMARDHQFRLRREDNNKHYFNEQPRSGALALSI